MKMTGFSYLIKEGFRNVWNNRIMSIASICVLISCLVLTRGTKNRVLPPRGSMRRERWIGQGSSPSISQISAYSSSIASLTLFSPA